MSKVNDIVEKITRHIGPRGTFEVPSLTADILRDARDLILEQEIQLSNALEERDLAQLLLIEQTSLQHEPQHYDPRSGTDRGR